MSGIYNYVAMHGKKKKDFAFVILLGVLNLGNYFGLSRCTQCNQ